eukprot:3456079-Pyramimonas_sp.AAC.1
MQQACRGRGDMRKQQRTDLHSSGVYSIVLDSISTRTRCWLDPDSIRFDPKWMLTVVLHPPPSPRFTPPAWHSACKALCGVIGVYGMVSSPAAAANAL